MIRTISPRFIGRFDRDEQGDEALIPEDDGVQIVVEQWNDPRTSDAEIQEILAAIAADFYECEGVM